MEQEFNKKNVLLSYPRSGNHLVRFLIEYLTLEPTLGCPGSTKDIPIYKSNFGHDKNPLAEVKGAPRWQKHHFVKEIGPQEISGLIYIFRDPVECLARHKNFRKTKYTWQPGDYTKAIDQVKAAIDYYVDFTGPKFLIKYEELMEKETREKVIRDLCEFLGGSQERLDSLLGDLDENLRLSRDSKVAYGRGECVSKGDIKFHSRRMENLAGFKEFIGEKLGKHMSRIL